MSEVTQDSTGKAKVTAPMMEAAMNSLSEWNVGKISRKIDNRDIVYEMLEAALKVGSTAVSDTLVKTEAEWKDFFSRCSVIVKDARVGQGLFRQGLESIEGFQKLIETIAKNGNIIIPLCVYPGVALFTDVLNPMEPEPRKVKGNSKE